MNFLAEQLNNTLGPVADLLSPAGRRLYFPYGGILGQGAEAKSCAINATIGMAFEEDGSPLVMDSFAKQSELPRTAFLYAGSFGIPKLREAWAALQIEKNPSLKGKKISNPVVTNALTHGIRIVGELFVAEGDEVIVPDLYWDNYSLVFEESCGGVLKTYETFKDGAFNTEGLRELLLAEGEKKTIVLNFPNNPTGYTCTDEDAKEIVAAVKEAAEAGKKVIVVMDDAYFGLVYEDGIHGESLFSEFSDIHENVLAVKLDGTTKEDYVWGLRVGFLTFAFKGATDEQLKALEAKAAGNVRSAISNVTSIGQHMAIKAFADPEYALQKKAKYDVLKARYAKIREILASHPEYSEAFDPMPFNSGYFMCVKPIGADAETVRKVLVEKYSTGTIVLSGLIRLAFSTVALDKLEMLFANVVAAIKDVQSGN
jgi:aspartate/methionine/tyrosine aminotransferase